MLDFYRIRVTKKGKAPAVVWPDFLNLASKDLMVRGGEFYAFWDFEQELWSTNLFDVARVIDNAVRAEAERISSGTEQTAIARTLRNDSTGLWKKFIQYMKAQPDNFNQLDSTVAFANTKTAKSDYVSKLLPYSIEEGSTEAFHKLFGTIYDDENLTKLMYAIGSVISGASKYIQKFYVLYGAPGTGKSTALQLIRDMFLHHVSAVDTSGMARAISGFPLESLKSNSLIGIDHEGDLSRMSSNSVLNSVVSHDEVVMNVKYQSPFRVKMQTLLFIATNKPVEMTSVNSGLTRRLVDIRPTGILVSERDYNTLTKQIQFELGAIAYECLNVYSQAGRNYYTSYRPEDMLMRTNHIYNFIDEYAFDFEQKEAIALKELWTMYKAYCEEAEIKYRLNMNVLRDELKEYWEEFLPQKRYGDKTFRSVFVGFKRDVFSRQYAEALTPHEAFDWLDMDYYPSIFDREHADQPAQVANKFGTPSLSWEDTDTKLKDIDTTRLHYVLPKPNLITIDFDVKDTEGKKSLLLNKEAAQVFPPTYAETSKSGSGIHLHYYYDGDPEELARVYDVDIEIIRPVGLTSIRRQLTVCNTHPIATISGGLPLRPKKGETMVSAETLMNERVLRSLIARNLMKDIHPATKPSVMFIEELLKTAYNSGIRYDVRDLRRKVLEFAAKSTNHSDECVRRVENMQFVSDHEEPEGVDLPDEETLVFFDLEVYPNLFLVVWKYRGSEQCVRMFNPSPGDIAKLLKYKLVGFNNRRYDNHMLYGRLSNYNTRQIYELSRAIIVDRDRDAFFREAWGLSWADVYDFASKKQSLKHWEIELGLPYVELALSWDEPVGEELWETIAKYCENDVRATEAVFEHRFEDYKAKLILAELSGRSPNDRLETQAAALIFGRDAKLSPEARGFLYSDLSKEFPGYKYERGVSTYKGEKVGEGGYVWAVPGMYRRVAYLDIASMHPATIERLNLFGDYTERYSDLKKARIYIKEKEFDKAGQLFDGRLAKYLKDDADPDSLSYALKIALNSVYGLTAARFDNPFRDPRNIDNIVAKRGALFMVDLKNALLNRGAKPIHFKTDSVKLADFTDEDIEFVIDFGKQYGYDFGIEGIFEKMVLINDAVLVGKWEDTGEWETVGARFAHPFVYKTIFTKEPIVFNDMIETRSVQKGQIYMETPDGEDVFVGRIGQFCPVVSGNTLYRVNGKQRAALSGTKGYQWQLAEIVKELNQEIDRSYFEALATEAVEKIAEFGDPTMFLE